MSDLLGYLLQMAEEVTFVDKIKRQCTVMVLQHTVVIIAASQIR